MTTKQLPLQISGKFELYYFPTKKLEREPVCGNIQGRPPPTQIKLTFPFIAKGRDVRVNISQDTINIGWNKKDNICWIWLRCLEKKTRHLQNGGLKVV